MEKPTENTEKQGTTIGTTNGKRVARCLTCSHEWYPRDGTKEKPVRCPECGKRNVKWKDLCTPEELTTRELEPAPVEKPVEQPPEIEEPTPILETEPEKLVDIEVEEAEETPILKSEPATGLNLAIPEKNAISTGGNSEPVTLEEIQANAKFTVPPLWFVFGIGLMALAGLAFFFFRRNKKRSAETKNHPQRPTEEEEKRRQQSGGTPLYGGVF